MGQLQAQEIPSRSLSMVCDQPNLNQLQIKYSEDTSIPFHRLQSSNKKIVTMGKPN